MVGPLARSRVYRRADHDDRDGEGQLWDVPEDEGDVDDGSRGV